jgi:hydroxyacylglutathione hydrolase
MKLIDGLYAYPWTNPAANNTNSYVVRAGQIVLIDPGHLQFLNHLFQAIRMDGIYDDQIQGVVCTHAHPDHLEGLQAFEGRPVWTALGLKDHRFLQEAGDEIYRLMGMNPLRIRVDLFLKEGELILGGEAFQVIETPGHSPGSICLYWPARKALFTGDVVFEMGVGRTDFPGGDGKALMRSLERLAGFDAEILLPGHGNPIVGRERIEKNFETIREMYYGLL